MAETYDDAIAALQAMDAAEASGGGDFQAARAANGGSLYGPGMAGFYPDASSGGGGRAPDLLRDPLAGQSIDVGAAATDVGRGLNGWGAAGAGAVNMLTLGYGDELAGRAAGFFAGPDTGQQVTEAMRGVLGGARESHPYATLAGEVAGGFALPVGKVVQGAGWLARIGRPARAGAG